MDTVTQNRFNYIGGSDIPVLLNKSKLKARSELIEQYKSKESYNYATPYTQYGHFMEESIREYINEIFKIKAVPSCKIFEDEKIRCNTDGYDEENKLIIEVKTNNGKHGNTFDYELQMQLYMWAFNVDRGYLIQYERPKDFYKGILENDILEAKNYDLSFNKNKLKITEVSRNKEIIDYILKQIKKFWEEVNDN